MKFYSLCEREVFMYTAKELYAFLNTAIPASLSCKWDNDGAMCMSDPDRIVNRVLLTLDITQDAVDYAVQSGCDAVISHHPLIFAPMRSINGCDIKSRIITKLMRSGVSAFSFHTRLDALEGGVNDALCKLLKLENIEPFIEEGIPLGRIGTVPATTARSLASTVKSVLSADSVSVTCPEKEVSKIVVVGGSGKDCIDAAIDAFADCMITGEASYNALIDAADSNLAIICAGHFHTENPVLKNLGDMIGQFDSHIIIDYYDSNLIHHI